MNAFNNVSSSSFKFAVFVFISFVLFYFGKHWSDGYQHLIFFSSTRQINSSSISVSPNFNKTFNLSSIIFKNESESLSAPIPPVSAPVPSPRFDSIRKFGILDENGTMLEDFEVGDLDPQIVENLGNVNESASSERDSGLSFSRKKFEMCPESMTEYIPCLDNVETIKRLKSSERGERFQRHCPENGRGLNCLVPAPDGYRKPIPWPRSRDEVWFSNVPHTRLVEDKEGQNWITKTDDKFKFPGGGTQFIHGADGYLDQISQMIPDIAFGHHTRVVMDVGCGVASFGAYLLSRNVITMSMAPKDIHENQIQFALERGVPAMVAAFATRRLPYPSQAFELIHCSRCRINWTRDDGILLLEVNRMLRGGGYFAWAAQPVYKHEEVLEEQWEVMLNLTNSLCWELVKKDGYIAIWKKPVDNSCYLNREAGAKPPLCDLDDDPDNVWYVGLKVCITRLPENGFGSNITTWPKRLQTPPDRLQTIQMDAYISRNELFKAEMKYWSEMMRKYIHDLHLKKRKVRNVLDMRAGFGGFAAALMDRKLDCWIMNVVPISENNTLPVIYDRGLIGVIHDWCEPFDTYPRTYDLLHAAGLFSVERKSNTGFSTGATVCISFTVPRITD